MMTYTYFKHFQFLTRPSVFEGQILVLQSEPHVQVISKIILTKFLEVCSFKIKLSRPH